MSLKGINNLDLSVNVSLFTSENASQSSPQSKLFKGRIFSRDDDQTVVIQLENVDDSDLLSVNKPILLFVAHDLGVYIFSVLVGKISFEKGNVFLHCYKPRQVKYFQRRKSVRVKVNTPVNFSTEFERSKVLEGTITDISINGLQVESGCSIPSDSVLELVYLIEDIGPVFLEGKVVRTYSKNDKSVYGIEFLNIDKYTVDNLAKFIIAEQLRQKRLGLQVFKAFIFNDSIKVHTEAIFSIIKYKNLDISALQGKKCSGYISEIGIHGLIVECPLKLPPGCLLEFSFELPKHDYTTIRATVKEIELRNSKYIIRADFDSEYEKIRDCIFDQLTNEFRINI